MGVTYYANYFAWFEAARTEYFRAIGFAYAGFEKQGLLLPVADAHCRYLAPSSYDDLITIRTVVSQIRQSSLRFEYHVLKEGNSKPIATGYTVHVFSDRSFKPVQIPRGLKSKLELAALEL